jgi:hypothetical protein
MNTKKPSSRRTGPLSLACPGAWAPGRTFWAGVLVGLGIGFLTAAVFVELELLTLHRKAWLSLAGVVLFGLG